MWRQVYVRLRSLWRWRRQESELDEEIRFHLAEEIDERIAGGLSPEEARAAARRDFGNVPLTRELTRETWGWGAAERLCQDARSAVRSMRRNPGYTCAVVVTLALGIGLNAAMYGLLSRLFLQAPPHIQDPDGIHRVYVRERSAFREGVSTRDRMDWSEYSALRVDAARFAAVAGATYPRPMLHGRGQAAESLPVSWVTGELFALLGVRPALGRPVGPEDDDLASTPVAVIGDGYARRRFGGAREALGASVSFDGVTYAIVGVLPPGFSGPDPSAADVWLPLRIAAPANRGDEWSRALGGFSLTPFVRLASGVTAEAAGAAATAAVRATRADSPFSEDVHDREATALLGPLLRTRGPSDMAGDLRLPLVVGGVALVVLLVAAANVTNLLMLRVAARRRELAVRNALGAGRWGVGRLLVIESVLLAAVSGVAALAVAAVAGRVLRATLLPRYNWAGGPLDSQVMVVTGVTVLLVGLAAALAPAVYAARTRGLDRLDGLRGARAGSPVRNGLIVAQAALSIVLLVGGGLFFRSFEAARRLDIGYARENLLTVTLVGGRMSLMGGTPLDETAIRTMEARVRALPDVLGVAQTNSTPRSSRMAIDVRVAGLDSLPPGEGPYVSFVTPGFFRVAGLAIRDGRGFVERDGGGAQRVAVVNTEFARRAWPGRRAIGGRLFVGGEDTDGATVVGVVETPVERGLVLEPIPQYYLPIAQAASDAATAGMASSSRALVVRTRGDPGRIVQPVLLALADLFPDLPRSSVQSMPAAFATLTRSWRIGTALFGGAALLALLLAAVGLYAVVAFGVRQRELEFGIRRALGAQSGHLLRLVVARGVGLVAAGVAAGGLGALWAGRFVAPLLFDGRTARDPLAFAAAALVLLSVALAASLVPARRAALADPRQALQAE